MSSNDIFMKSEVKPLFTDINNVIKINFSESAQAGGNYTDSIIHLSFTDSKLAPIQAGGADDTSEYFNRIASKIMNKMGSQSGGFSVNTQSNASDSDIFLSSETINQIDVQEGGATQKQKKTFNFNALKKHLLNVDLEGGSEEKKNKHDDDDDDELELFDDDEDDDIFEDSDDEDDEDENDEDSDDKIIKEMEHTMSESNKAGFETHSKRATNSRVAKLYNSQDSESLELSDNISESPSGSASLSLENSDSFQMSESISSPQLMTYRRVNKNNITGRRFI